MNKRKLLQKIAVTAVCSTMALTTFSFMACNSNDEQHNHNYSWVDDKDGNHHEHCDVEGCDNPDKAPEKHIDSAPKDNICDKCGAVISGDSENDDDKYDLISTSVDFKAGANELAGAPTTSNQTVGTGGYTYGGKFFFSEGIRFEPGNSCINTQKKDLTITLGGVENSIKIVGKGASGTPGDVVLKNASGEILGQATSNGNGAAISIFVENLPAGVYTVSSGTSVRISDLSITEKLAKSEATGIKVTASRVDFLINEDFSASGLTVILNYANGRKDTLSETDYEVTHNVDKSTAGKYTVSVKYKKNTSFSASYDVYVYSIDSIEQHTIGYANKKQVTLQQAAITGGTVSYDYITVKGTGTVEGRTHSFNLPATALDIENVSTANAGEKTVNVSVKSNYINGDKTLSCSYKVIVKDAITPTDNKVEITVGETGDFKTLTQAVQYLEKCNLAENVNKLIKLQAGTYTEKVRIELPNVTLMGLGSTANDTKLTYSLVEGDADALNGSLWGLDCATLHVTGKNFKAYNIAIHNDFDYINNSNNYSGTQAAQGLALTLEADGAVIYNCHLYGNQDTLYMKSGRSYYYQTQIDGNVDFIFGGEDALAYFDECKIVAINRTKVNEETGKGGAQNGYVTAAKHDAKTKPDYGYIFNSCEFTDDGKVADGAMSLGRPWGASATVAHINCSFSAAYSKLPSNDSGKDHRWSDWGSGATAANADFCEFGSTGAGAITEAVLGGKILTADQAANYTKANIFGISNGKQTYTTVFDCDAQFKNLKILVGLEEGEIPEDPTVNISLKDESLPNGDCVATINEKHSQHITWSGTGIFEAAKPVNGVKVGTDTVITVNVVGEVSLIKGYELPTSDYVITYKDGKATIKFIATTGTYGTYLGDIVIDTSKTPADTQTVNVTLDYNDDGATANGTLEAVVGTRLAKPADPVREGYKFAGWQLNGVDYDFTQPVSEAFTLVAKWEVANDFDLTAGGTVNLYEFTTGQVQGSTATFRGIIIDATTGKFAPRSNDVQVNAGVKIKFKVNDGTVAGQIGVSFTAAAGDSYVPTFNLTVETIEGVSYAVISITNNCYPSTMSVAISA